MIRILFSDVWGSFDNSKASNWDVLSIMIHHQEGHVAKAHMNVGNFCEPIAPYVGIFENDTLLFQGIISGFFKKTHYVCDVELLCLPPSFADDLQRLVQVTKLDYVPEFYQECTHKPSDFLEADNRLFYWDRCTGKVGLSSYFKGSRLIDLRTEYVAKSFVMQQKHLPFNTGEISLKVKWLQHLEGSFNLSPYIASAFPSKTIATLTPQAITIDWPHDSQHLGKGKKKTGYKVLKSRLTTCNLLDKHQKLYTATFLLSGNKEGVPKRLKIHYFKGYLRVFWRYQQPREEALNIMGHLNHAQQNFCKHRVCKMKINIHLPATHEAIFFETQKGQDFLNYAKKLLQTRLKASVRCIEVRCTIPWEKAKNLTLDDSISLNVKDFGKEKVIGKLVDIRLCAQEGKRYGEIIIACSVTKGDVKKPFVVKQPFVQEYLEELFLGDSLVSSNKTQGITQPILLGKNLVEDVVVKNSAIEQEAILKAAYKKGIEGLEHVLAEIPTSIQIHLKDLRTQPLLQRTFHHEMVVT